VIKVITMHNHSIKARLGAAVALSLGVTLAGCGGGTVDASRGLSSVNQPVVERTNYTLDLQTGSGGLPIPEQRKLVEWFEAMNLRYGDRIALDDPLGSAATREAVAEIAARSGLLLSDVAPVTEGFVDPGRVRIIVTRSTASVPGCPDWSHRAATNYANKSWSGFGCATNSNLAAMVADPEHLLHGATGTGETVVMSSSKAIDTYRKKPATGAQELQQDKTSKGNN
jgi:pilus assembly protein CpaD